MTAETGETGLSLAHPLVGARGPTVLRLSGSTLAIRLPRLVADIGDSEVDMCVEELHGRDARRALRAGAALAQLTEIELEMVAALACVFDAGTPAKRSWRGRFLAACAELAKVDASQLPASLMLARRHRAIRDALAGEPGRERPISPFTAEPSKGGGA